MKKKKHVEYGWALLSVEQGWWAKRSHHGKFFKGFPVLKTKKQMETYLGCSQEIGQNAPQRIVKVKIEEV